MYSCPKCWWELVKSQSDWYVYDCKFCDEDFYFFELIKKWVAQTDDE